MFFQSSVGNIFYRDCGPEGAMALVFNHGLSVDHRMFEQQVAFFKDRYRVIVWDLPEHGRSVKTGRGFSFAAASQGLVELLDQAGVQQAILVGVSLGGYVSQFVAGRYPSRVLAVVAVGATPLHSRPGMLGLLGFRCHKIMTALLPRRALTFVIGKVLLKGEGSRSCLDRHLRSLGKARLMSLCEGVKQGIEEGLEKPFDHPLLIVHGEYEIALIKKMCRGWHGDCPRSSYRVVPGAGHAASIDNPACFNLVLDDFLDKMNRMQPGRLPICPITAMTAQQPGREEVAL